MHGIHVDEAVLHDFCRQHQVAKLSLFGSILRDDFTDASDVDVLVEFAPGKRIGLLGISAMELELSRFVGRKVDLRTPQDISHHFRSRVLREAQVQYAA